MESELDKIYIRDLLLRCMIGINDEERSKKQDIVITITLEADLLKAGETDDIEHTVDYKKIKKDVINHVEHSEYFLIEKIAAEIARICLRYERVEKVRVLVEKPGALRFARTVGVEIYRSKQ